MRRVGRHCRRKGWEVEQEPHVRHTNGILFKPDLVVHFGDDTSLVCDVQVSWEGDVTLGETWSRKEQVYNNETFREAAGRRWPAVPLPSALSSLEPGGSGPKPTLQQPRR